VLARGQTILCLCCDTVGGSGGGLAVLVPLDPRPLESDCDSPYPCMLHYMSITFADAVFVNNSATDALAGASGGGLFLASGGAVVAMGVTLENNSAALFGGGAALAGSNGPTCSLHMGGGSVVRNNTAGHGGAQVYMGCSSDLVVSDAVVHMNLNGSQVAGPVLSQCPPPFCTGRLLPS
jgi:hypothetical protein